MWKVYVYEKCDTCRKALKFLRAAGVEFEAVPIRETPPTRAELALGLVAVGGERRKLFNVSGGDYRAMKLGERLPALSNDEALRLLEENGNLVKRPFVVGFGQALVGFDEAKWRAMDW